MNVQDAMKVIQQALRKDTTSSGLSTNSNLNFYYLEPQAKNIYPVYYPLLASIPRTPPMFNGQRVGGPAVNWKAIVNVGSGAGYVGISQGNRSSAINFTERDYASNYKYLGWDDFVTFQAEFTGLGFDDNLALAQISTLNQLLNTEEQMLLFGNSGSAGNGFQLGTPVTPTIAGPNAGGSIPDSTQIYVAVMALTGWGVTMQQSAFVPGTGNPPTPVTGCQLPFVRTTMNGAQDTINGGTSAMSAISAQSSATSGSNQSFAASTTAIRGAMGYAWYVGTANSTASLYFYGVTPGPSVTITSVPTAPNQAASASTAAGNFTTDNSANALDFDGETTWTFGQGGYWQDLNNQPLTSNGDGTIQQFEAVQDYLWQTYKIPINKIWAGGTMIDPITKKIGGTGIANNVNRIELMRDAAGNMTGGLRANSYLIKYGRNAGKAAPIETHPWLPQGVVYFELTENPYPQAANAIPAARRVVTLEDHFSIKWPYVTLQHQFGVYVFETMEVYIPFGSAILTGCGLT